jgi:hypothetical protein
MAQRIIFSAFKQQTLPVLGEIPPARKLDIQLSVLLHRPASHLGQDVKMFGRDELALGGQRQLWPPLHVGFSSARCYAQVASVEATKA